MDAHGHAHDHDRGLATPTLKLFAAVVLGLECIVGMLVPVFVKTSSHYRWWLSVLNCFSGGIFLAAGLLHLVPHCLEAQAALVGAEHAEHDHHDHHEFPLALLLIVLGYCLVFYIERVLFDVHGGDGHGHGHGHGHSHGHDHGHHDHDSGPEDSHEQEPRGGKALPRGAQKAATASVVATAASAPRFTGGFVLLVAMSFHTALESLALGFIRRRADFWVLFGAIASHKAVSALALSSRFLKEGASVRDVVAYVGPFAAVAPASILLGLWTGDIDPRLHLVLSCFAAGTFIYVGASEVLVEEFEGDMRSGRSDLSQSTAKYVKFGATMAAVFITALMSAMPHSHGEGAAAAIPGEHVHGGLDAHAHHDHHHHHHHHHDHFH